MKVALITLADFAGAGDRGKLNIMGVFDTIHAKQFPAKHDAMVLVVRYAIEYQDSESEKPIQVTLETGNGEKIVEIEGSLRVGTIEPGEFRIQNQAFQFRNLTFPRSGVYTFRVRIEGETAAELPLRLIQKG